MRCRVSDGFAVCNALPLHAAENTRGEASGMCLETMPRRSTRTKAMAVKAPWRRSSGLLGEPERLSWIAIILKRRSASVAVARHKQRGLCIQSVGSEPGT